MMIEITKEELERIVASAVQAAIKEERNELWIPAPQHFLDHQMFAKCREQSEEWRENHKFVSGIRSGAAVGGKTGLGIFFVGILTFIFAAIWIAIKEALKSP